MLKETFKQCFYISVFIASSVVSHLGTFTDLKYKLLEEFSGRFSINVEFYLNVSKKQQYIFILLFLGH